MENLENNNSEIPELTDEQIEEICEIAEEAAREYILSKIPLKKISDFDITVEVEGLKPLNVSVEVSLELPPLMQKYNVEKLTKEAVKKAFEAVDRHLKGLSCKSKE
ncbi:hypothetical protein DRO54_00555 [Candidatus Bathyarchaeota archaeon]|nr:MAG: hypothetical protein DRO54_00555 [Candidatus Bathyarchaeota archaeon]